MARPRLDIDPKQVEALAEIGATLADMEHVLGCSVSTLERRYDKAIKRGWGNLRMSLRRAMYKGAIEEGKPALLIFWAKQKPPVGLGWRDNYEFDASDLRVQVAYEPEPHGYGDASTTASSPTPGAE